MGKKVEGEEVSSRKQETGESGDVEASSSKSKREKDLLTFVGACFSYRGAKGRGWWLGVRNEQARFRLT